MTATERKARRSARITEARGKVRETAGKMHGNREMESAGKRERLGGQARAVIAEVKERAHDAAGKARERIDR